MFQAGMENIEKIQEENDIVNVVNNHVVVRVEVTPDKTVLFAVFDNRSQQLIQKGIHQEDGEVFQGGIKITGILP
jgi:hypothetical protein